MVRVKADRQKQKNKLISMYRDKNMRVELSRFKDTKTANVLLGEVKNSNLILLETIREKGGEYEVFSGDTSSGVAIIIPKDKREDIQETLTDVDFAVCPIDETKTAAQIIEECYRALDEIDKKSDRLVEKIMTYESIREDVMKLYDYLTLEVAKAQSRNNTQVTDATYYLEAWLPQSEAERVDKELTESPLSLAFLIRDPLEGGEVPTLALNHGVVAP